MRKGAIVSFFKSSGYYKLELKHQDLVFLAYRMHY